MYNLVDSYLWSRWIFKEHLKYWTQGQKWKLVNIEVGNTLLMKPKWTFNCPFHLNPSYSNKKPSRLKTQTAHDNIIYEITGIHMGTVMLLFFDYGLKTRSISCVCLIKENCSKIMCLSSYNKHGLMLILFNDGTQLWKGIS